MVVNMGALFCIINRPGIGRGDIISLLRMSYPYCDCGARECNLPRSYHCRKCYRTYCGVGVDLCELRDTIKEHNGCQTVKCCEATHRCTNGTTCAKCGCYYVCCIYCRAACPKCIARGQRPLPPFFLSNTSTTIYLCLCVFSRCAKISPRKKTVELRGGGGTNDRQKRSNILTLGCQLKSKAYELSLKQSWETNQ